MNDTLARLCGESMGSQCNVLRLLQRLGVQECEATLADGGDVRVVGVGCRVHRDVYDDGVLCELVEVRD